MVMLWVSLQGDQCEDCLALYVGNARDGGSCRSCWDVCSQHSQVCLSKQQLQHNPHLIDLNVSSVSCPLRLIDLSVSSVSCPLRFIDLNVSSVSCNP